MRLSYLGDPGSGGALFCLACMVLQRYFGKRHCMAAALSVWCSGLLLILLPMLGWDLGD